MSGSELAAGPFVASILQVTPQLIAENEMDKAKENYMMAIGLLEGWYRELLSEDPNVAERARNQRLPPGENVATFAAAPIEGGYRILSAQGDLEHALKFGEMALSLYQTLAPTSLEAAECLDEVGDIAAGLGENEFSNRCFEHAMKIREHLSSTKGAHRA
jgi:hypothetical protein